MVVFFYCVRDAAVTRGQYLALRKVWWSSFLCISCQWTCLCSLWQECTNDVGLWTANIFSVVPMGDNTSLLVK